MLAIRSSLRLTALAARSSAANSASRSAGSSRRWLHAVRHGSSASPGSKRTAATAAAGGAAAAIAAAVGAGICADGTLLLGSKAALCEASGAGGGKRLKRSSTAKVSSNTGLQRMTAPLLAALLWRLFELAYCLCPVGACYLLHRLPLLGRAISRERLHGLLVDALERTGPVGIKWGQWASSRFDIFEEDFCQSMGCLTNRAPEHTYEVTRQTVERSFGKPVEAIFNHFETHALASGSIGQVHLATLKSDGRQVAVKVQHPNLPRRLMLDMTILRRVAALVSYFSPTSRVGETAHQFATNFEMQLDFEDEAANLRSFTANFSSSFWSAMVSFPQPIEGLVAHDVLVETYEEGESIATFLARKGSREEGSWEQTAGGQWIMKGGVEDETSVMRRSIATCGIQSYLKMLIWDNLIHADLHPGNVLVRMEDISLFARMQRYVLLGDFAPRVPHIVFLDAGLAASFNNDIFSFVHSFFDSIVNFDGPRFGKAVLGLSPTQPYVADPDAFVEEVTLLMREQKSVYDSGAGHAIDNIMQYMQSVRDHSVVLDPTVMVSLMSMLVLAGWQNRLDPAVSIMDVLENVVAWVPSTPSFLKRT